MAATAVSAEGMEYSKNLKDPFFFFFKNLKYFVSPRVMANEEDLYPNTIERSIPRRLFLKLWMSFFGGFI